MLITLGYSPMVEHLSDRNVAVPRCKLCRKGAESGAETEQKVRNQAGLQGVLGIIALLRCLSGNCFSLLSALWEQSAEHTLRRGFRT